MLNTTLNYLDHFARFTQKENVEAVERLLSTHKDLEKFERAQLGKSPPPRPPPLMPNCSPDEVMKQARCAVRMPTRPRR